MDEKRCMSSSSGNAGDWIFRSDLKVETETLCAAQEQTIRANYVKHHIDKNIDNPLCRMCEEKVCNT